MAKTTKFVDPHTHIYLYGKENYDKVKAMFDIHKSKGVTDLCMLSYFPGSDIVTNINGLWWKKNYTDIKLRTFGALHENDFYKDIPYEKQYERLMALGCDGIKFLLMKPDSRKLIGKGINHPSYDKVLSMMEADGTPVMFHSGDPDIFWDINRIPKISLENGWFYGDGTFPTYKQLYEEDFEMLDKHPNLNITFAHFFFLSNEIDEARRIFDKYPNVKFDLTPGGEMFEGFAKNIDAWHDFFEEYSDRILFGTDTVDTTADVDDVSVLNATLIDEVRNVLIHDRSEYFMPLYHGYNVKGLDLCDETYNKICYDNCIKFLGKDIKPVNDALFMETVERMYSDLKNLPEYAKSVEWLRELLNI